MKKIHLAPISYSFLTMLFLFIFSFNASANFLADGTAMQGRWDLTIEKDGNNYHPG